MANLLEPPYTRHMKTGVTLAAFGILMLSTAVAYAQDSATQASAAQARASAAINQLKLSRDYSYTPPLRSSSIGGNMLSNESEYLTPGGIVDQLPESQIEPAAGPTDSPSGYTSLQKRENTQKGSSSQSTSPSW
jgi:hypothetical protein